MSLSSIRPRAQRAAVILAVLALVAYRFATHLHAQAGPRTTATPQKLDEDYGARIKKATPDTRILTELVDHMPLSADQGAVAAEVPRLRARRERAQLTYHKDIVRYLRGARRRRRRA